MGKVIKILYFAFLAVFCVSCGSHHTNYSSEKESALHAKFSASEVSKRNVTNTLMDYLSMSDSTLRNAKVKITLYDTNYDKGQVEVLPVRAQIEIEEQIKEGRYLVRKDTQMVEVIDTLIFKTDDTIEAHSTASTKKEKRVLNLITLLLLITAVIGVVQIFRQK